MLLIIKQEQQRQCVRDYQDSYVLKICGVDQFLLAEYPTSQYKVNLLVYISFSNLFSPRIIFQSKDCQLLRKKEGKVAGFLDYMV